MHWERPDFTEIRMDSEINAYQGDDAPGLLVPWWILKPLERSTEMTNENVSLNDPYQLVEA